MYDFNHTIHHLIKSLQSLACQELTMNDTMHGWAAWGNLFYAGGETR